MPEDPPLLYSGPCFSLEEAYPLLPDLVVGKKPSPYDQPFLASSPNSRESNMKHSQNTS